MPAPLFLDRGPEKILSQIEDAEDAAARGPRFAPRHHSGLRSPWSTAPARSFRGCRNFWRCIRLLRVEMSVVDARPGSGRRRRHPASANSTTSAFGARKLVTLQAHAGRLARLPEGARRTPKNARPTSLRTTCIFGPGKLPAGIPGRSNRGRHGSIGRRGAGPHPHRFPVRAAFASVIAGLGVVMVSTVMAGARKAGRAWCRLFARLQALARRCARGISRRARGHRPRFARAGRLSRRRAAGRSLASETLFNSA